VYDATWTLVVATRRMAPLMGQTTSWRGIERNSVWRNLIGPGTAPSTPREKAEFELDWSHDLRC